MTQADRNRLLEAQSLLAQASSLIEDVYDQDLPAALDIRIGGLVSTLQNSHSAITDILDVAVRI